MTKQARKAGGTVDATGMPKAVHADVEDGFQELLAAMQTQRSRRGVKKAFAMSPEELGAAAVKTAAKSTGRS